MSANVEIIKPCESFCVKCGGDNIYRRFFEQGEDTLASAPNSRWASTDWVNRTDRWAQEAKKDCIVHICRCCGFLWDSDPLTKSNQNAEAYKKL